MPLTGEDWGQIAAWAEKRDQRLYGHLLLNRFFQGYVTAVIGSRPYQVLLQRISETTADGASYMSPNPGYFPRVGDLVECVWRDDKIAYVLWPLNSSALTASRVLLAPPVLVGAAAVSVTFANLPSTARNLILSGRVFGTDAAGAFINWQANLDGGNRYSSQRVYGVGGPTGSAQLTRDATTSCYIGSASASGYATGATFTCTIPGANLSGNHVFHSVSSRFEFGATVAELWANWWNPSVAQAITRIDIFLSAGNFNTGTVFELSGDI